MSTIEVCIRTRNGLIKMVSLFQTRNPCSTDFAWLLWKLWSWYVQFNDKLSCIQSWRVKFDWCGNTSNKIYFNNISLVQFCCINHCISCCSFSFNNNNNSYGSFISILILIFICFFIFDFDSPQILIVSRMITCHSIYFLYIKLLVVKDIVVVCLHACNLIFSINMCNRNKNCLWNK